MGEMFQGYNQHASSLHVKRPVAAQPAILLLRCARGGTSTQKWQSYLK